MDPAFVATLSIASSLVGVVLTLAGGFAGALIQSRSEHRRWLRQERVRAYVPAVAFLTDYDQALASATVDRHMMQSAFESATPDSDADAVSAQWKGGEEALAALRARATKVLTPLQVLGPEPVQAAAAAWELAAYANEYGAPWLVGKAAAPLLAAMQEALGVEVFEPHSGRRPFVY